MHLFCLFTMKNDSLVRIAISTIAVILGIFFLNQCQKKDADHAATILETERIAPLVVTEPVNQDSDDPAIWIHPQNPAQSLVLGTDKGGSLFTFGLDGKIVKQVSGMQRLNNVDVEYGFNLGGQVIDIAVATDRDAKKIHVFHLPTLALIDGGGIEAFAGEEFRRPMGIAIYKRPEDGAFFAIVSRKRGPSGGYLWQYLMEDAGDGSVKFTRVRAFGEWSGKNAGGEGEIEAVAVDDAAGYVYYSDELFGIRKYHANPDVPNANEELACFGTDGFRRDREGISIYHLSDGAGYIIVSDQQTNLFQIFTREGAADNPHRHKLVKTVKLATNHSDGSAVTNANLSDVFAKGLFVAMSDDRTFHFYSWADIAGDELQVFANGVKSASSNN